MLPYVLSFRFIFWFAVGGGITAYMLHKRGHDPLVGGLICGVLGGFGGFFLLMWFWLYIWYFLPPGVRSVGRVYNSRRWKIRW